MHLDQFAGDIFSDLTIFRFIAKNYKVGLIRYVFADSSQLYNTELVQQKSGYNISLKCELHEVKKNEVNFNRVQWSFKQCGDMTSRRHCDNALEYEWKRLVCNPKRCNSTLNLLNLSDSNSGLYKCTIFPYKPNINTTINIKLVKIYQLRVKSGFIINISSS